MNPTLDRPKAWNHYPSSILGGRHARDSLRKSLGLRQCFLGRSKEPVTVTALSAMMSDEPIVGYEHRYVAHRGSPRLTRCIQSQLKAVVNG